MRGLNAIAWAAALVLPVCAAAQDKPGEVPSVGFISNPVLDLAPPLTPEQQTRLPLASELAERVVPP